MRKLLLVFMCTLISPCIEISAQDSQEKQKSVNTMEDKTYALSLLWSEIKYNFVNIDKLKFDIDSLYRETMKKVLKTDNDIDYYKELKKFLITFNDAHTQLLDIPDCGCEETDYCKYSTGLFNNKFYFSAYRSNCTDVNPELLGAEIIEIEGLPAMEYAQKYVMTDVVASTDNYRKNLAGIYLLNGKSGTHIKGKARRLNGKIIPFNIVRNGEATRTENDTYFPKMNAASSKTVRCYWKGRIAVLTINSFQPESVSDEIDNVMKEIKSKNPAGLIIDLRNNGGGITEVALRLQMYLTKGDSIRTFGSETRANLGYGRAQGNFRKEYEDYYLYNSYKVFPAETIEKIKTIEPIQCPVAILIGPYSFSACEDFLVNIYEVPGRPIFIGEETAGSTGAPLVIELPHEALARICTLRILYPYSLKPFVGKGIMPDIEVKPTINDHLKGVDVVIRRAMEVLNKE